MQGLSALGVAFYVLVLVGAFAVRSAAGFGAGLIAVPMLAFILPLSAAVSVSTALTTLTSIGQVGRDWRQIAWRRAAILLAYTIVGIGLGFYCIKLLNEETLRRCLGAFLIFYAAHALWAAHGSRLFPARWHGILAAASGIAGGLVSALFGGGAGPIYVIYFSILRLEKEVFRATMSGVVLIGGATRMAGYGSYGFYGQTTLSLLALGLPLALVGSWFGDRVVRHLSARAFSRFVAVLVLLSGLTLLVR